VALADDLERIAAAAARFAGPGERVSGVVASEPLGAGRVYLCAYESDDGRSWLALDETGVPIANRLVVREAASLAALCEVAEDVATIEPGPRVATPAYLDELGAKASAQEGFTAAVQQAMTSVEELAAEVERTYKGPQE
jgi:hypothetical protein